MSSPSNPIRGALSALLLLALSALVEYLFHWLVVPSLFCLLCLYLVACRVAAWLAANRYDLYEDLYEGVPFALILLAVFQLQ